MVLLHMVSAVSGLIKVRYLVDKAVIDNMVFRTHYRLTAALLFVCCIIVTANNLIGDPIQCISTARISSYIVNNYCWITQTFTMPDHLNDRIGVEVPHPGLANDNSGPKQYHSYYQWVPFVLFFQGLLFYLPHMIWKCWEEGKMRMITDGLRGTVVVSKEQKVQRQNMIVIYLMNTLTYHNYYAFGYYFCEFLNFLNVICNILFLDLFFDGFFLTYGLDVLKFSNMEQEKRLDPMIAVFPRMTKCNFFKYGSSGTLQKLDTICILALNIINEKIFILLWFWFVVLAIVSTLTIIYSFTIIVLPSVREFILRKRIRYSSRSRLSMLMQRAQIGDFLILHFLSKNLNYFIFKEILDELIERLNCDNRSTPSAPSTIEMGPMGAIYSTNDESFDKV